MRKIGVTGAETGWTHAQAATFRRILAGLIRGYGVAHVELHHGVCVGVDEQANDVARAAGVRTVGHPPTDPKKMADCELDERRPAKKYLDRNKDIAGEVDYLIVIPRQTTEVLRDGTWTTKRAAERCGTPFDIIWKNGGIE